MRRFGLLSLSAFLAIASSSTRATAADPPCRIQPNAQFVDVAIHGDLETAELVRADLFEFLGRKGLFLRASIGGPDEAIERDEKNALSTKPLPAVAMRALVILRDNGAVVLLRGNDDGAAVMSRNVEASDSRAVLAAEVAEIVHAAAEATCDGAPPPIPPPEPRHAPQVRPSSVVTPPPGPSDRPEPAPKPTDDQPGVSLALTVNTTLQRFADHSDGTVGVGLGTELAFPRLLLHPAVGIAGRYFMPSPAGDDRVSLQTARVALRTAASIEALRASWFALSLGLCPGVDVLVVDTQARTIGITPHEHRSAVDPILGGAITAHASLGSGIALELSALLDWDFAKVRYVVETPNGPSPVLVPFDLRPGLTAGLSFDLLTRRPQGAVK